MAAIPANITVQQGNGNALVKWDAVPSSTYDVERSTDGISYTLVASAITPTEFFDAGLTFDTKYFYRVQADDGVPSGFSAPVTTYIVQPGQMTLSELRQQSRERADRVNSDFVTDEELNTYINQSYFELYDILVQKFGNEYFVAPPVVAPTTGNASIELPNGQNYAGARPFYKLLGLDLQLNSASGSQQGFITLHKFEFIERNRYVYPQLTTNLLGADVPRYRIVGNEIQFIPVPQAGQNMRIWYVPRMQVLLQDTDIADGVSGWTEYIIVDAAIKMLQKEESDVSVLAAQKMMLEKRIEEAAENRDIGLPETVSDVRRRWDGAYGGLFGDGPFGGY
jgi:hypothetical protein